MKLVPCGQTCCPSANNQYINGFFRLHRIIARFSPATRISESWDALNSFAPFESPVEDA
jgi:hypothetical protein